MSETRKFPNGGYDVVVVNRKDIMQTIKDTITDPEVVEELINGLEIDATNFVKDGKWTGIPFLGNIRCNQVARKNKEDYDIIKGAYESLDKEHYIMFVKQKNYEAKQEIRSYKYYRYIVSRYAAKHRKEYLNIAKKYGELYARIYMYSRLSLKGVDNEIINEELEEQ